MAIKSYKPTTPSRRQMTVTDYSQLSKVAPEKSLLEPLKKKSGRNSYGRIISAFPSATSKYDDVKQQLQNIHTWAIERREASLEMKKKIKETKAEYKEKVKTINENAKGRKNG